MAELSRRVFELYDDPAACAAAAGLSYVSLDEDPTGICRRRRGRGFSYTDASGRPVREPDVRARIAGLAIPPAWQQVWICADPDGHIAAIGVDDRGRRQYRYHDRWRQLRDVLNAYRLIRLGERLPAVRDHVQQQLRRRTLDRDRVLAVLVHIVDRHGIRIGGEEYAEENETYGLTTLTRRHVKVRGDYVELNFPAKSGRIAQHTLRDPPVAQVVAQLAAQRHRRLFTVDGVRVDAADLNALLAALTGEHVTAKDFRTWRGTVVAFDFIRARLDSRDRDSVAVAAVDAAAAALSNTRAVARAHYVHPDVLESYQSGRLADDLAAARPARSPFLAPDERVLLGLLRRLLVQRVGGDSGIAPVGAKEVVLG